MPPRYLAEIPEAGWPGRKDQRLVVLERNMVPPADRGRQEWNTAILSGESPTGGHEPVVVHEQRWMNLEVAPED